MVPYLPRLRDRARRDPGAGGCRPRRRGSGGHHQRQCSCVGKLTLAGSRDLRISLWDRSHTALVVTTVVPMHEGEPRSRAGVAGCTLAAAAYVVAMLLLGFVALRWLIGMVVGN